MDLPKVKHFRGTWTLCVLADSHVRPSSGHKSQVWREILSMNAERSSAPRTPLLAGRPDAGRGLLKKPSMISAAEDLQKGKSLAKDKGCLNEGGQKVEGRRSEGVTRGRRC